MCGHHAGLFLTQIRTNLRIRSNFVRIKFECNKCITTTNNPGQVHCIGDGTLPMSAPLSCFEQSAHKPLQELSSDDTPFMVLVITSCISVKPWGFSSNEGSAMSCCLPVSRAFFVLNICPKSKVRVGEASQLRIRRYE